jgi:hypothetical protein
MGRRYSLSSVSILACHRWQALRVTKSCCGCCKGFNPRLPSLAGATAPLCGVLFSNSYMMLSAIPVYLRSRKAFYYQGSEISLLFP